MFSTVDSPLLIGLVGRNYSGKSEVGKHIAKTFDMEYLSARDLIAEKMTAEGIPGRDRTSLRDAANQFAQRLGPDFLVKELIQKAHSSQRHLVLDSLRRPAEIDTLKTYGLRSYVLAVEAPEKFRQEMAEKRRTLTDTVSPEKREEEEWVEMTSNNPYAQNVQACITRANYIIQNPGTSELYRRADNIMGLIL